jgi:hypothetical protein
MPNDSSWIQSPTVISLNQEPRINASNKMHASKQQQPPLNASVDASDPGQPMSFVKHISNQST